MPSTAMAQPANPARGYNLNVLIEGQSNACYFSIHGGMALLAARLRQLLGFDGVTKTVTVLGGCGTTAWGATGLIPAPQVPLAQTWLAGKQGAWKDGELQTAFIRTLQALPKVIKLSPTATIWMHNENDSANLPVTTDAWISAIKYNVAEERAAFAQGPATMPIDFVYVPFDFRPGWLQAAGHAPTVQALDFGFERLCADTSFNASIGAQLGDSNMDGPPGAPPGVPPGAKFGGLHFDQADINQAAGRIALTVANQFWQYAQPGSPAASAKGTLDAQGPQANAAVAVAPSRIMLSFIMPQAAPAFSSLTTGAAAGAGWTIVDGTKIVHAKAAKLVGNKLLVTFNGTVPRNKTARLYYGYGDKRIFVSDTTPVPPQPEGPGEGTAVYDTNGLPVWVSAAGLPILAAMSGAP